MQIELTGGRGKWKIDTPRELPEPQGFPTDFESRVAKAKAEGIILSCVLQVEAETKEEIDYFLEKAELLGIAQIEAMAPATRPRDILRVMVSTPENVQVTLGPAGKDPITINTSKFQLELPSSFYVIEGEIFSETGGDIFSMGDAAECIEAVLERDTAFGLTIPESVIQRVHSMRGKRGDEAALAKTTKPRNVLPTLLAQSTFLEARQFSTALSDGRDGRNWGEIQGAFALLHCPPKSKHETRFEPNSMMLNWWGVSATQPQALYDELARLDLDAVILFQVTLSAILHTEKARWSNVSLDSIIKLIGRDSDARRSAKAREELRNKVWRCLVLFDSMSVVGARGGKWREPGAVGEKREKMDNQTLYSRDPLIRIVGTRDTEQGSFDSSAPPKEVSIVPGDWLMQFHGNREILSEMGNVLQIAAISRGKPSGAWAACAGLMLNQLWREGATRAVKGRNSRGKESKTDVLKYRPFTRRELLEKTIRSDYDVNTILNDAKSGYRARDYWKEAVKELKKRGVIGHYAELKAKPGENWRDEWLDQPLDIRPVGETLENALTIHGNAEKAKKRGKPRATVKASAKSSG